VERFDDDGDFGEAFLFPAGPALEAVEDFVASVRDRRDADRQRGEVGAAVGTGPSEMGVGRAYGGDRDVEDSGHLALQAIRLVP
jgi:hypothetical protein